MSSTPLDNGSKLLGPSPKALVQLYSATLILTIHSVNQSSDEDDTRADNPLFKFPHNTNVNFELQQIYCSSGPLHSGSLRAPGLKRQCCRVMRLENTAHESVAGPSSYLVLKDINVILVMIGSQLWCRLRHLSQAQNVTKSVVNRSLKCFINEQSIK
ncbi:hypothetical protein TNCV_2963781 [Trichonephila clavipes]|nr:hypothetical protein TNCV_2963781 [Trichonephila clavipes]